MREVAAYVKTTPIFVYNVTDSTGVGLGIANYKVCAVLHNEDAGNGETHTYVVLPTIEPNLPTSTGTVQLISDRYCATFGRDSKFLVRLPLHMMPRAIEGTRWNVSIRLYNFTSIERGAYNAATPDNPVNEVVEFESIVIDSFIIEMFNDGFPTVRDRDDKESYEPGIWYK